MSKPSSQPLLKHHALRSPLLALPGSLVCQALVCTKGEPNTVHSTQKIISRALVALLLLLSPYSWTSSLKGTQLTHVQLDVPQNPQFFSTDLFQGAMDGRAAPPIQSLVCKLSFANKTTCPGAFSPSGTLSSFAFSLGYHLPSKQRMTVAFHHLPVVQASACSLRSCLAEHHILQKYMFYRGFLCPSWDLEFLS